MSATHQTTYHGLVMVVSAALGGSEKSNSPGSVMKDGYTDVTAGAPSLEAAIGSITKMLSF